MTQPHLNEAPQIATTAIKNWLQHGILPVVTIDSVAQGLEIAEGLLLGGIPQIEITLRTPAALPAMQAIAKEFPSMAIAAGTLLKPDHFDQAQQAGASLFISPGFTPKIAQHALDHHLLWVSGASTASEMMQAMEMGFFTVKFFPAMASGGLDALKSITAPLSDLQIIPTGGITLENCTQWHALKAVVAVGGSWLTGNLPTTRIKETVCERAQKAHAVWTCTE